MSYRFPTPIANPTLIPRSGDDEALILRPGSHTVPYERIPSWWFTDNLANLYWDSEKLNLPAAGPDDTLFRLRGADRPVIPHVNRQGSTPSSTTVADGSLIIANADNKQLALFGGPNENIEDGRVQFKIPPATQLPSLYFHYKL